MATRRCKGKKTNGDPCTRSPLRAAGASKVGLPAEDQDYCESHHPDLTGCDRFGSPAQAREAGQLGGRPPLPKPTDVARRLIEENIATVLRPHFRALGFDVVVDGDGPRLEALGSGAVIFGESKDGDVVRSEYEDLAAQIAAAEKLLDRVYGRPKQQTEISGPAGGPVPVEHVDLSKLSPDELKQLKELRARLDS